MLSRTNAKVSLSYTGKHTITVVKSNKNCVVTFDIKIPIVNPVYVYVNFEIDFKNVLLDCTSIYFCCDNPERKFIFGQVYQT